VPNGDNLKHNKKGIDMDTRLQPIVQLFSVSESLFKKAVKGLSREEFLKSPGEHSNSMLWIAGHIACTRCLMINLLGDSYQKPWNEMFNRGAAHQKEGALSPGIDEILKVWDDATDHLKQKFEHMNADELDAPSPREFPLPDRTMLGALNFFSFHETYHVGQMAYLLTWLGKERLVG
jgi:uncharacterized damage-inducible protein DinB